MTDDKSPIIGLHWSVPMMRAYKLRRRDDRFYGVTLFRGRLAIGVIVQGPILMYKARDGSEWRADD